MHFPPIQNHFWQVSIKGSTEYTYVQAPDKESALALGAKALEVSVEHLEADLGGSLRTSGS